MKPKDQASGAVPDLATKIKIMIWMIIVTLFMAWLVLTEGNIFLRDNDDDDPTHQSIDL